MKTTTKEKAKRLNVTADESHLLKKLAREIRQLYTNTDALVKSAKEKGRAAIAEAILCGSKLNEAKKVVGHGGFLKWLKKNCKGVTDRTARNYMTLANRKHVSNLNDYNSLRQAYIAVGIIEDSEPDKITFKATDKAKDVTFFAPTASSNVTVTRTEPVADSSTGVAVFGDVEPLQRTPNLEPIAPVAMRRTQDSPEARISRVRTHTVALESELRDMPEAYHAECRRIIAGLVAFVNAKQTKARAKPAKGKPKRRA